MGRRSSAGRMGRGVISEVELRVEDMVEVVVGCEIVGDVCVSCSLRLSAVFLASVGVLLPGFVEQAAFEV